MRPMLVLLVLCSLVACGDNSRPTAPRSSSDASPSVVRETDLRVAAGKPAAQVGFTKMSEVISLTNTVQPGTTGESQAVCPEGTVLVGGTFHIVSFTAAATPAWVWDNEPEGVNTWVVRVTNKAADAGNMSIQAIAFCLS